MADALIMRVVERIRTGTLLCDETGNGLGLAIILGSDGTARIWRFVRS